MHRVGSYDATNLWKGSLATLKIVTRFWRYEVSLETWGSELRPVVQSSAFRLSIASQKPKLKLEL
jgi:hypothetical protein